MKRLGGVALLLLALPILCSVIGCQNPPPATRSYARFVLEGRADPAAVAVELPLSRERILVRPQPVLTEYDMTAVEVAVGELGPALLFQFNGSAARALYRLSATRQGQRLVLMVGDQPAGAVRIESPISEGKILIYLERPDAELRELAGELRAGLAALARGVQPSP